MRDDHVPVGPGAFVEAGTVVDRECFRDVDLYMVDVVAVPHGFEHAVREAQRDQVLHCLPAEDVVDAKYPVLG